jgi:hypothetical protein
LSAKEISRFRRENFGWRTKRSESSRSADILAERGAAVEVKTGRVDARQSVRNQIARDSQLMNGASARARSVLWVFAPGKSGLGPTAGTVNLLNGAGIPWVQLPA